ncbi:glycoside hydrolase family 81 protein [Medicago truncatula]|nr:glycoside hydrolase family 81 protein [Medicago truncatula]
MCLRCLDLYKLHSWAGGLTEFADGRNQDSTSESVNAYYSSALIGMEYENAELILEILAAKMMNNVIGVRWSNKRDWLCFGPAEWNRHSTLTNCFMFQKFYGL